ncbi:MAG: nuclear transport factor 2 family protein [Pseudomonadota bacterium]|nr:nuclear transport factor 2 family protein [Pseudomonadota bacterium]MEC8633967.1 nuclear transport factor 2 family protein [Pseudomonadota bacterium]
MNSLHLLTVALRTANSLKALAVSLALLPAMSLADNQRADIDALIDGLHQNAHEGNFQTYFDRYTPDAVFLGTDKSERWTIEEFKVYAEPAFEDGHGWTYLVKERNWEGEGNTRWFDEVLLNEKLGHCRGTGVVELIDGEWKIAHYALTMLVPNDIAAEVGTQTQRADGIYQK